MRRKKQKARKKKQVIKIKERIFIKKAKEQTSIEEFVRKMFDTARCGIIEVQHTPVVTRIIIYTTTPGLIIGSGGDRIKEAMDAIKQKFGIENPQIDVQKIDNPDVDPYIISKAVADALEAGINFKRIGNQFAERIMDAGAVGCEIVLSGVISGARGRTERFAAGYIKKSGNTAEIYVMKGHTTALPKRGAIGVTVKIMLDNPELALKAAIKRAVASNSAPKIEAQKDEQKKKTAPKKEQVVKTEAEVKPAESS